MTTLAKPVRRETAVQYRGRPLIAELHAGFIHLREKGRRAGVSVDFRTVYELGWKMIARQAQVENQPTKRKRR
jgi:hypothetical protein